MKLPMLCHAIKQATATVDSVWQCLLLMMFPCIFPSHLLPLALHADHANYVAHKHRRTLRHMLRLYTYTYTSICMYVRTHMDTQCCHHLAVRLSDAVRQAGSRGCKAGRQGGREATRAKNPTNASACTAKVKLNGLAVHSSRPTHTGQTHARTLLHFKPYCQRERERERECAR